MYLDFYLQKFLFFSKSLNLIGCRVDFCINVKKNSSQKPLGG